MIWHDGIAYAHEQVGREFAPLFAARLRAFMRDDRIIDRVWVVSGSRPKETGGEPPTSQRRLFTGFVNRVPGFNLAANPDRVIASCRWATPTFVANGSWHMQQKGPGLGGSGAADLGWAGIDVQLMHVVAFDYGLRFPVPGENWHCQAYTSAGVFPAVRLTAAAMRQERKVEFPDFGRATDERLFTDQDATIIFRREVRDDDTDPSGTFYLRSADGETRKVVDLIEPGDDVFAGRNHDGSYYVGAHRENDTITHSI